MLLAALVVAVVLARAGGRASPAVPAEAAAARPAEPSSRTALERPPAAPAAARGSYRGRVPILMYHVITAPPPGTAYPELWTSKERFAATMRLLAKAGYRGVTLAQVRAAWTGGPGLPAKPVVVSFDDGYLSQYTHAKPVLRRLGWPGVLYLEGKNLGTGGLTVRQVRGMIDAGWELGAHSLTHPDLTTLDTAGLRREVAGSRALLRRRFGVPVESFCYPAGRNDATVRAAVRDAGYDDATTVEPGIAGPTDDRLSLPRIRVDAATTPGTVLRMVRDGSGPSGGYG
ncbi:unannotated protein [freshwater metagenome]|uniref:Unannotated protein n=1 Tax=freshwater metagenome TaxID=449393 RepID=A0A6J7HGC8_9ZZZZ